MWPQEAHDLLKEPDVTVTNQSDKDVQLELLKLDEQVRIFWIDKIRRETGIEPEAVQERRLP